MKSLLTNAALLAIGFGAVVAEPSARNSFNRWWNYHRPHGHLAVQPVTYDFGLVMSRHKLECKFLLRNVGPAPLQLIGAQGGCGCTTAVLGPTTLQSHQTAVMHVAIDPRGQPTMMRRAINISTDEPGRESSSVWVAARLPDENRTPRQLSRAIFNGKCAACHKPHAEGESGRALYDTACAMCHEPQPDGLQDATRPKEWSGDWNALTQCVRHGMLHASMPAFARSDGGPLTDDQIDSLKVLVSVTK